MPSAEDIEAVATAMAPDLFRGSEESVGPATRYERNKLRRYARAAILAMQAKQSQEGSTP